MGTPFMAELRVMSFNFAPRGWALCNGQLLPINQNQALFSLLGTTYGGDGRTTFGLPNLQGRVPMHPGAGHAWGETGGEEGHVLTTNEIPSHTHNLFATNANDTLAAPTGNLPGTVPATLGKVYAASGATLDVTLATSASGVAGGSQPHLNMQPFLALNVCIALQGIFPSRN